MSDINNANHLFHKSIGGSNYTNSLPNQVIPRSKKDKKWERRMMDVLEDIAVRQYSKNIAFKDYYDMINGDLQFEDFDDTLSASKNIANFKEKVSGMPSFLKYFDLLGLIVNQIAGQYDNQKDRLRVDSIDIFSNGEYFRERNMQVRKYTEEYFNLELQRLLVLKGINVAKKDFNSEEERQQYAQQLEQEKNNLVAPEQIQSNLKTSFRAKIAEWAEATLESDYLKHDLAEWDLEEFIDYLLTGRYFRHYHIGYDYYKPERWNPIQTFISEELNLDFPQDGEYGGHLHFLSPSELIQRYGDKLPLSITKKILGDEFTNTDTNTSIKGAIRKGFGENHLLPFAGYYTRDLAQRVQAQTGVPMGVQYGIDEQGEQTSRSSYLYDDRFSNVGLDYINDLRHDISVRTDLLQLTEAYWRGSKMMGLLTIENPLTNDPYQIEVEEDLLKEYLKENNIKQIKTVSLEEAKENKEMNTVAWFAVPQVWKGKKLNAGNSTFIDDFIFDVKPLPFQIRQDSEYFDVKLPIAGIITNAIAKKIKSFSKEYNLHMNMIRNATEKHIGEFILFDLNLMAAQYKNEWGEDSAELIDNFTKNLRDVGMEFIDGSLQNTKGMNPNQASVQKMSISFIQDMQIHAQQAEYFMQKAYEQIGVNKTMMGQPDEYSTAEGIKQGLNAGYAQLDRIFRKFNMAKRKEAEIHVRVAQYCVKNNKDISYDYTKPDVGRIVERFTDENFHLRKIQIIPMDDSSKRKQLETFRQYMMQNNTANNNLLDFAKIFTTKSFKTLVDYAQQAEDKKQANLEADRQNQQQLLQQKAATDQQLQKEREAFELEKINRKVEGDIRVAEINGVARAADNNADKDLLKIIQTSAADNIREQQAERKIALQEKEVERKQEVDKAQARASMENLNLELEKLKLRNKEADIKLRTSIINKN